MPFYLLNVTEFLGKSFICYVKIATYSPPLFPSNPSLKVEVLSSAPLFENLVGGSPPPPPLQKGGGGAHYAQEGI